MSSLILDSLEIKNFRAFRHLLIERLGRVNLIVGQNNVGKTCLLEALWLYASRGSPDVMQQILSNRNEFALVEDDEKKAKAIKYLFYGREDIQNITTGAIEIGSMSQNEMVSVWSILVSNEMEKAINGLSLVSLANVYEIFYDIMKNGLTKDVGMKLNLSLSLRKKNDLTFNVENSLNYRNKILTASGSTEEIRIIDESFNQVSITEPVEEIPAQFIPYRGVEQKSVAQWWDSTYLTESEDDVLDALHIIEPKIRRIGLVENRQQKGQRVPMVRLSGEKSPVLLSSLGQGMNHLFALALALVNAKDGFLLIDEVENGIYHGTQPDLWGFIFKMARRLNVQVFATTHSRDSLEAFHEALQEDEETDGLLISLRSKQGKPGEVVGVLFERENLAIITDQQIEVR